MTRKPPPRKPKPAPQSDAIDNTAATDLDHPVFGQPSPTPDPTRFEIKHPSDGVAYKQIDANGQIVFHATGDTGSTRGPESQSLVADKMVNDFTDVDSEKPVFFFHL